MGVDALKRPAVFLDRDGVINRAIVRDGKPYPPDSADDLQILDGVADALERLSEEGYLLIVITNQPDVARGKQTVDELEAIHQKLHDELPLDEIVACCHDDADECDCRKPQPGALLDAAKRHGLDLKKSYMIGDRWRDVEAGQRAGVTALFIDYGYRERQPEPPFVRVASLAAAADWIIERNQEGIE